MKVSIITAVRNNVLTIHQCINSIHNQSYNDIEHIVIDGGSSDGTIEIIKKCENNISHWVSEPDDGIYYALNKGLKLASGEIIGFLHANDFYVDNKVIEKVVAQMAKHSVDSCYGDLMYVNKKETDRLIRYWKSGPYQDGLFHKGWMPPHPTFFVKKKIYDTYGYFNTNFKISADYELMLRFLEKNKILTHYIPEVLIKMRIGGISNRNLKNIMIKMSEDYRAWKENDLNNSFYAIFLKNVSKLPQFFKKN